MKIRTIAIVSASLLALGAVAWAAGQDQSPTNDQSPAYNQTTPGNHFNGGMTYDYHGQYLPYYYGCVWDGPVHQGPVSNQVASGDAPQSFWHRCCHWFGWMNPWHHTQGNTVAYRGCCR